MQKNPLLGKVALITGAARRIGADIARTLHEAGMNIALHYHASHDDALTLCHEFNQARAHSAIAIRGDLEAEAIAKSLIASTLAEWNRLDVVVNNASRFYRTDFATVTEFAWDDLFNCNIKAPFFLAQAATPALKASRGAIINITDIHGEKPLTDYSVYCISKSALLMMTKVLAKELGPEIRVNAVSPGAIIWPEGKNQLSAAQKEKIIDRIALGRSGSPDDIAKAVLFLVRDADYVTGQVINVDGGRAL